MAELTLHIGAEPFNLFALRILKNTRCTEWYEIPKETASNSFNWLRGGRVVAVGTICARSRERCYRWVFDQQKLNGDTSLFITPDSNFRLSTVW